MSLTKGTRVSVHLSQQLRRTEFPTVRLPWPQKWLCLWPKASNFSFPFLLFFVVNCRFGSIMSRVMLPCTANFCKQRNSQQLFCLFYSLSFSLRRLFSSKVNDCPGFLTPHLLLLPLTADLTLYFDQTAPIPPQPTLNDHQPLCPLNFGNFD